MNLPLLSWVMLITLVAPFSCQRLQNEFEFAKVSLTEAKDNNLDDLNEIPELTTIQSVTEEDVTLQDEEEESSTEDPLVQRQGRKLELKDVQGRFSIKEKLCSLGLADCTPKERDVYSHTPSFDHSKIEYVQPVKVVPDGPPVPAVSVHKKQDFSGSYDAPVFSDSYDAPTNNAYRPSYSAPGPTYDAPQPSYNAPSSGYGVPKPTYDAPKPTYDAPKPSYNPPVQTYGPPKPSYDAPKPVYNAPKPSYNPPTSSYGAPAPTYDPPKPSYNAPTSSYGAPAPTYDPPKPSYSSPTSSYGAPAPTYDAPKPSYGAPTSSYGAPASSYGAPAPTYDPPKPSYSAPTSSYGAPAPTYDAPKPSYGAPTSSYAVSNPAPVYEPAQQSFQAYPTTNFAQGVPITNQAAPVYIPSASGYDSPVGTRFDPEEYIDDYDFNEDVEPVKAQSFRHDRKLDDCQCVPSFQCPTDDIFNLSNLIGSNNVQQTLEGLEQPQIPTTQGPSNFDQVSGTGFSGITDYSILIDPRTLPKEILAQDDSDTLDLSEEHSTTVKSTESTPTTTRSSTTTSSSTTLASARFRRDETLDTNPQTTPASESEFSPNEIISENDSDDVEDSDGSGDSELLTRDGASIDLGSGDGEEGTEGRIFEGIPALANLLNFSTPKIGGLEPTVGVSFGLPQYGQSYGGQPFNYLNTGTAINPYYGGGGPAYGPNGVPSRISLGAVDINPLISFQSIANGKGELIKKPLINLHVTPNGCGLLGCDEGNEDYGYPAYNPNPLAGLANLLPGFGKSSYNKGPSSQYHSPPPQVPLPQKTYGPPSPNYETGFKPRPGSYEEPAPIYYDTFKTSPQPSYNHLPPPPQRQPQPQYQPSGSVKFAEPQAQVIKHEHHHYHYGSGNNQVQNGPGAPQGIRFGMNDNVYNQGQYYGDTYGRSAENNTSEVAFKDDNTVKRNTNQVSFGIDNEKKEESGFKFPKGRSLEPEANLRRKRNTNEVNIIKRESLPTGFKAPTCGGPSSGYVCCRSGRSQTGNRNPLPSANPQLNNFEIDSTIRNPKSQESSSKPQSSVSSLNQVNLNPKTGQCGQRNAHGVNGRIASSNPFLSGDTDFAEYPWQVAILKKDQFDNMYVCGGSLIDAQHILTAAHCIKNYQAGQLRVRVGEWDVNNDSEFYKHIEFDVSKVSIHEDFYPGNLLNDIALLRIDGFVDFDKNIHISPACLPDRFTDFSGSRCQVTGWGKDAFTKGSYQQVLKEVEVPIINNQRCENMLRQTRLGPDFALHPGFLCAGGEEGRDACTGDGGGPLVCEANGSWQLVGIVSWGVGCGERDVPGVYVKVAMYESWIQKQITTL